MSQLQEPDDQTTAGELDPNLRRHLETQLAELNARYDMLAKRIAAVDADFSRPHGDGVQELILRERKAEMVEERDHLVTVLDAGVIDGSESAEVHDLRLQEFRTRAESLSRRIAALSADEERAAKVSWLDREGELRVRKDKLVAEQLEVAAGIAELKAKLGQ